MSQLRITSPAKHHKPGPIPGATTNTVNILDQITESQVSEWMLAKLASLRESDDSFRSLSIDARHYKCMDAPETTVTMHADEVCVTGEADIATATQKITERLYGNAVRRAAELRKEAEAILTKASELESRSAIESNAPNNRPQDGRVCDCEDAPCCGHYES